MNILILQSSPRAKGNTPWMAEEYKQAAIHRFYNMMTPPKLKKMALLMSSYSPGIYDAAIAQYKYLLGYWKVEDTGIVTAKLDEQKTDDIKQKVQAIVSNL
mgnify:CR=1 FL=1